MYESENNCVNSDDVENTYNYLKDWIEMEGLENECDTDYDINYDYIEKIFENDCKKYKINSSVLYINITDRNFDIETLCNAIDIAKKDFSFVEWFESNGVTIEDMIELYEKWYGN